MEDIKTKTKKTKQVIAKAAVGDATVFDTLVLASMGVPDAMLDVVTIKSFSLSVEAEAVDREVVKPTMGMLPHMAGKKTLNLELQVEITPNAALGEAPQYGPLLRMCGLAETLDATPVTGSVIYKPLTKNLETGTIHLYRDGLLWEMDKAVGTFTFDTSIGEVAAFTFTLSSLYKEPTEIALPPWEAAGALDPFVADSTDVVSDGEAILVGAFSFDAGNEVAEHYRVGEHHFSVSERAPTLTFTKDSLATATEWIALAAAQKAVLNAQYTQGQGMTFALDAPHGVRESVGYGERNEMITTDLAYRLYEDAPEGDDQFTLTFAQAAP